MAEFYCAVADFFSLDQHASDRISLVQSLRWWGQITPEVADLVVFRSPHVKDAAQKSYLIWPEDVKNCLTQAGWISNPKYCRLVIKILQPVSGIFRQARLFGLLLLLIYNVELKYRLYHLKRTSSTFLRRAYSQALSKRLVCDTLPYMVLRLWLNSVHDLSIPSGWISTPLSKR